MDRSAWEGLPECSFGSSPAVEERLAALVIAAGVLMVTRGDPRGR